MKLLLATACGGAVGTLAYTALISSAQQPDWGRAVFVGLAIGLASLLWTKKKPKS